MEFILATKAGLIVYAIAQYFMALATYTIAKRNDDMDVAQMFMIASALLAVGVMAL